MHYRQHLLPIRRHRVIWLLPLDILRVLETGLQRVDSRARDLATATPSTEQNRRLTLPRRVRRGREPGSDSNDAAEDDVRIRSSEVQRQHGALAIAQEEDVAGGKGARGGQDVEDGSAEGAGGTVKTTAAEVDGASLRVDEHVIGPVEGGGGGAGEEGRDGAKALQGDADGLGEVEDLSWGGVRSGREARKGVAYQVL